MMVPKEIYAELLILLDLAEIDERAAKARWNDALENLCDVPILKRDGTPEQKLAVQRDGEYKNSRYVRQHIENAILNLRLAERKISEIGGNVPAQKVHQNQHESKVLDAKSVQYLTEGTMYYSKLRAAAGYSRQLIWRVAYPDDDGIFIFGKRGEEYGVFAYSKEQKAFTDVETEGLTKAEADALYQKFKESIKNTKCEAWCQERSE